MKKLALFLIIALASTTVFAVEFDVLGNAFYRGPDGNGDVTTMTDKDLTFSNFDFGADIRLKFSIFRFDMGMIAMTGGESSILAMPLDAGLSLDLLFIRVGAGIGTQFVFGGDGGMKQSGYNVKASADILFGGLDIGLVAYQFGDTFDELFTSERLSDPSQWLVGATLGFRFR